MIYVDPLQILETEAVPMDARKYGREWCHMWSDQSLEELHVFAARIALPRSAFLPHNNPRRACYLILKNKRLRAVQAGAREATTGEWGTQIAAYEAARELLKQSERERSQPPSARETPEEFVTHRLSEKARGYYGERLGVEIANFLELYEKPGRALSRMEEHALYKLQLRARYGGRLPPIAQWPTVIEERSDTELAGVIDSR